MEAKVKIACHCGEIIFDITDNVPNKAHLIPDQAWYALSDAIDTQIIDALARKTLQPDPAYRRARELLLKSSQLLYQCQHCGRLYIDDRDGNLQCYVPATEETSREILRGS